MTSISSWNNAGNFQAGFGNRRTFENSSIGGIVEAQVILDFCAEHRIAPVVEIIPAERINQAWERVLASDVRIPIRHRHLHPRSVATSGRVLITERTLWRDLARG